MESEATIRFREKMMAKYGPSLQTVNGLRAPQPITQGNGMRFTGRGPSNQPAGIVHKGEMVVEAPMVQAAGGPREIRGQVEQMAAQQRLPGYQLGTGDGLVGAPDRPKTDIKTGTFTPEEIKQDQDRIKQEFFTGLNKNESEKLLGTFNRGVSDRLNTLAGQAQQPPQTPQITLGPKPKTDIQTGSLLPTEPPVATPEPAKEPEKTSDFRNLTNQAITGIQKTAAGQSEADRIARERAQERLAGASAAETMSLAQSQAQRGVEGGTAAAEQANLQRQQNIRTSQEMGQISENAALRQERAQSQLAELGMQGEQMEEGMRQFDALLNMDEKKLDEGIRQFALNYGLDVRKVDEMVRQGKEQGRQFDALLGMDKDKFEEGKKQFAQTFGLDERRVDEMVRQAKSAEARAEKEWSTLSAADQKRFQLEGETIEMAKDRYKWEKGNDALAAAAAAGNFTGPGGVEDIWKERGYNIDASRLQNSADQAAFGDMAGNVEVSISEGYLDSYKTPDGSIDYDAAINDGAFKSQLEGMAKVAGYDPNSTEGKNWMKATLEARNLKRDPFYSMVNGMDKSTIDSIIGGILPEGQKLEDFEYPPNSGQKGADAGRNFLVGLLGEQALGFGEDGNASFKSNSPIWNKAFPEKDTGNNNLPPKPTNVEDIPKFVGDALDAFDKAVSEMPRPKGGSVEGMIKSLNDMSSGPAVEAKKTLENIISKLSPKEWNSLLGDENVINKLENSGIIINKTLSGDYLFSDEGMKGLKVEKSNKGFVDTADKGSIIIHNSTPYRLVEYKQTFDRKDTAFGKDRKRIVVYAVDLTNNERVELINEQRVV